MFNYRTHDYMAMKFSKYPGRLCMPFLSCCSSCIALYSLQLNPLEILLWGASIQGRCWYMHVLYQCPKVKRVVRLALKDINKIWGLWIVIINFYYTAHHTYVEWRFLVTSEEKWQLLDRRFVNFTRKTVATLLWKQTQFDLLAPWSSFCVFSLKLTTHTLNSSSSKRITTFRQSVYLENMH